MSEVSSINMSCMSNVLSSAVGKNCPAGIDAAIVGANDLLKTINKLIREYPDDPFLKDAFSRFSAQVENMKAILVDARSKGQASLTKGQLAQFKEDGNNIVKDANFRAVALILEPLSLFVSLVVPNY